MSIAIGIHLLGTNDHLRLHRRSQHRLLGSAVQLLALDVRSPSLQWKWALCRAHKGQDGTLFVWSVEAKVQVRVGEINRSQGVVRGWTPLQSKTRKAVCGAENVS